jgi:RNA exonuclease 1
MAYTTLGMEVIRLSVVDVHLDTVLDIMIATQGHVLDFNTRYSGITASSYQTTCTLAEAQDRLFALMNPQTVLIGHSLDSDLKSLRIQHDRIIDTSILYPHHKGLPYRWSLRHLAREHLQLFIQQGDAEGHDSAEDACIAMRLVLHRAK